jgi:two-component system NtrC family sensor kinase
VEINCSFVRNPDGEPSEILVIARDISERKQMQEQLIMTDRLATIGELVSGIAHELNNPLTSIIGFSQLAKEEGTTEDLDLIHREAQRAAGIVKNLLSFARKHAAVKQFSQINNIIDDVLKLRSYEQKINNIQVIVRLAADLPEIMVDYFQIQQVFLNIIVNAESAMLDSHKHGILTITTERSDNYIRISFADDGPGIPKENLSRIFSPFFTTKEVGKGTGLGLSICHGILTEHGGKIRARNCPDTGAIFDVELPIEARP